MFNILREAKGLCYHCGFENISTTDFGIFRAKGVIEKSSEKESIKCIREIFDEIKINGVTLHELEMVKAYIRTGRIVQEQSTTAISNTMASLDILGFGYNHYLEREKRLEKISLKDIKNEAKEYLNNFSLCILG